MTAREHAEMADRLATAAATMRRRAVEVRGNQHPPYAHELEPQAERQERAAHVHAMVALALAATDVTTGKATVKRRLA